MVKELKTKLTATPAKLTAVNTVINASSMAGVGVVLVLLYGLWNQLDPLGKIIAVLAGLFVIILVSYIAEYMKKEYGIDPTSVLMDVEAVLEEISQLLPLLALKRVQTQYGNFDRGESDPIGVYSGNVDFGQGVQEVTYIDIEAWEKAGGKTKNTGMPVNGLTTIVSRYGLSKLGKYNKMDNTIYTIDVNITNIFAAAIQEEERQKNLLISMIVDAYNTMLITEGKITGSQDARAATPAMYESVILPDIKAHGMSLQEFLQKYGRKMNNTEVKN